MENKDLITLKIFGREERKNNKTWIKYSYAKPNNGGFIQILFAESIKDKPNKTGYVEIVYDPAQSKPIEDEKYPKLRIFELISWKELEVDFDEKRDRVKNFLGL